MMKDRHYAVDPQDLNLTFQQFMERYGGNPERSTLNCIFSKANSPNVVVVFCEQDTLTMNSLKKNITWIQNTSGKQTQQGIMIGKNDLASQCRKELRHVRSFFLKS